MLIAGNSLEPICYNIIKDMNAIKSYRIGQSAAKRQYGEGSTTIPTGSKIK